jgi:hypothetical protein
LPYRIGHGPCKGWWGPTEWRVHPLRRRQGGLRIVRLRRQRLAVRAVELHTRVGACSALRVAEVRVGGVRGDEGLRLRGDRSKHALLIKALAVGAPSVGGVFEARATDL